MLLFLKMSLLSSRIETLWHDLTLVSNIIDQMIDNSLEEDMGEERPTFLFCSKHCFLSFSLLSSMPKRSLVQNQYCPSMLSTLPVSQSKHLDLQPTVFGREDGRKRMEGERLAYECPKGGLLSWLDAQAQGKMVKQVQLTPSASHLGF